MTEYESISKEFLTQYYTTIMQNRNQLINFYNDNSFMSYGGQTFRGIKEISEKIESFGFQKITYSIDHQDVQPGPIQGSFLIFVSGGLVMDDNEQFKFSQVFNICPNGQGGLYCHNDIFTIVIWSWFDSQSIVLIYVWMNKKLFVFKLIEWR